MLGSTLKKFPFHPFLIGIYPAVALLGHNIHEIQLIDAARACLLLLAGSAVVFLASRLFWKSWLRAGLVTSFILVLIFLYGNVYTQVSTAPPSFAFLGRHRIWIPVFLLAAAGGVYWISRRLKNLSEATLYFNILAVGALAIPLYQIVSYETAGLFDGAADAGGVEISVDLETLPDIYYIILDAYSREDVLEEIYSFDNTGFITELESLGFFVAACSQSNYSKTRFSLLTTLNMEYFTRLENRSEVSDNKVRSMLESIGYVTVSFPTGFYWTEMADADYFIEPGTVMEKAPWYAQLTAPLNNYEVLLIDTSLRLIVDGLIVAGFNPPAESEASDLQDLLDLTPRQLRYEQVLHAFDALEMIPDLPGPKFVYAHIVSPHPPYVFTEAGHFVESPGDPYDDYIQQLKFVNRRVVDIVRGILDRSETPPIIIIQGDHAGSEVEWTPQRVRILNAYYLPEPARGQVYSRITPINTFRLIFGSVFGLAYDLVEDRSFNSVSVDNLLDFTPVPNTCRASE